eukprot:g9501.t1
MLLCEKYLRPNDRVLVLNGSGGVGVHLLQMLKPKASFVAATSTQRELVEAQGADQVVDYRSQSLDVPEFLATPFDLVIDLWGTRPAWDHAVASPAVKAGREGGRYVTMVGDTPYMAFKHWWHAFRIMYDMQAHAWSSSIFRSKPAWTYHIGLEAKHLERLLQLERGEPSGEVAEAGEEEGDGEEADEEATDANRGFVQVAKQALLWERAVTQRLRSQLDMAEAWAGPSDGQEVLALKAQVASLTKQNEQLQRDAERAERALMHPMAGRRIESSSSTSEHPEASEAEQEQLQKAQEEAADLKSKLKAAEARLVQEQDQREERCSLTEASGEAAAKEVERLREQVSSSEANREAQAIRACVDELRANAQKATVLQAKLTAAEDQAKSLQEQLEQREAAAQKEVERWRVQVAEAHRAEDCETIRACVEELRAQLQDRAPL